MNHSQLSAIFSGGGAHNSHEQRTAKYSGCAAHTFLGKEFPTLHAGLLRALIKDGLKFEPKLKTREQKRFVMRFQCRALNAFAPLPAGETATDCSA
jgi:hypothetical protein